MMLFISTPRVNHCVVDDAVHFNATFLQRVKDALSTFQVSFGCTLADHNNVPCDVDALLFGRPATLRAGLNGRWDPWAGRVLLRLSCLLERFPLLRDALRGQDR